MKGNSASWYVYKHTSPSGKVYIGITGRDNPEIRWCKGTGYSRQVYFGRAIAKYGWENIKHEILLSGVSKEEAIYAEKYLIKWYKMHNISYNITDGGEGHSGKFTAEHRKNISKKLLGIKRSEDTKRALAKIFSKAVIQFDPNTREKIKEYESIKQAAISIGRPGKENNIAHVLHKRYKTAYGFYWEFKN